MTNAALRGKPDAGNPHVRFDEGEVASAATPRRGSLLYRTPYGTILTFAGLAIVATWTVRVFGAERTWTGGAGTANWADPGNWDTAPAQGDTVVFRPSGSLTVNCPNNGWTTCMPAKMRIESGDVTVNGGSGTFYMATADTGIYVAKGARAVIVLNNHFYMWSGNSTFRKTGEGELVFKCASGEKRFDNGATNSRNLVSIDEGTMSFDANGGQASFYSTNIVVESGAKLVFNGDCRMNTVTVLDLKGNAEFTMTDSESVYLSNITGSGSIYANAGTKTSMIILALKKAGIPQFTGSFGGNLRLGFYNSELKSREAATDFIVQYSDQLANIVGVRYSDRFFKYAAGVGEFTIGALDGWYSYTTNYIQDVEGNPITLRTGLANANGEKVYVGPGDMWITSSSVQSMNGSKCHLTGWLGAASGGKLTLGYNGDDFDLTKATGTLKGIRAETGGTVNFNHSVFANIELPVRGSGLLYYVSPAGAKFTDLELDGATELWLGGRSELAGGDVSVDQLNTSGGRTTVMRISGGRVHNGESIGAKEADTDLKSPNGVETVGNHGTSSFEVTGGDYWWREGNSSADIFLRGGVFHPTSGAIRHMTAGLINADSSPRQIVFDGGTAELYAKSSDTFEFLKYNSTYDNANYIATYVTDKGGRIVARKPNGQTGNFTFVFTNSFATCTNVATSAALTFSGWGDFVFGAPMALNGPVEFRDGTAIISAPQLPSAPFGSGDLRLRNARVFCDSRSGAGHGISSIPLATGSGSAVVYEGACEIAARNDNASTAAKAVTANAVRRAGPGSALYLRDGKGSNTIIRRIGEGAYSTVKLAEAPEVDSTTGLLRQPIFIGMLQGEYLATYTAEGGFVPHDTVYTQATDLSGGADKVASLSAGASLSLAANEEASVAAIRFGNFARVTLYDNARLKVGNGTDPAVILLSVCGKLNGMNGTIDFGTSEGVIGCSNCNGAETPSSIACKIVGSGGVSYVSDPEQDSDRRLELHGSSTYTGGTRISAVRIGANANKCFSSGDVYIFGGEAAGGAVVFRTAATWANNFHIAGHGYHDLSVNSSRGCLEFKVNATMSGNVEIVEEASVNVAAGCTGTISGTLSGDRLKLYRSEGVLKLGGSNTYTGGTEVARSTLSVSAATGLGTGEVVLDGGVVEFGNAGAMTVANDWRGIGTVRMAGAEVKFSGDVSDLNAVVDFPSNITLTEIPPFASAITNSAARASTLTLATNGDYALDPDMVRGVFKLVLEDGASLDLGGETLVVWRFTGDRSAVDGEIVETNPAKGLSILVK